MTDNGRLKWIFTERKKPIDIWWGERQFVFLPNENYEKGTRQRDILKGDFFAATGPEINLAADFFKSRLLNSSSLASTPPPPKKSLRKRGRQR